ncbi:hypothetical protein Acr_21g0011630 [Actinidia rufa]|uniref:Uncharacterized protein n=1 Tax=Actinidia rufa TaxID=165716 RepID=A0A7J0GIM0_9ERIC|nr:hypothetical protein Acr_21g0011630 [Actinidia rufa]
MSDDGYRKHLYARERWVDRRVRKERSIGVEINRQWWREVRRRKGRVVEATSTVGRSEIANPCLSNPVLTIAAEEGGKAVAWLVRALKAALGRWHKVVSALEAALGWWKNVGIVGEVHAGVNLSPPR